MYKVALPENEEAAQVVPCAGADLTAISMVRVPTSSSLVVPQYAAFSISAVLEYVAPDRVSTEVKGKP